MSRGMRFARSGDLRDTWAGRFVALAIPSLGGPGNRSALIFAVARSSRGWFFPRGRRFNGVLRTQPQGLSLFQRRTSVMADQKIRIRLKAFDHRLIDRSASE